MLLPPEKECVSANVGGKFLSKVIATVYVAFIFINLSILFQESEDKMNVTEFMIFLFIFSTVSALIVEGIKKTLKDKKNLPSNIFAIVVALVIGICGMFLYYYYSDVAITTKNVVSAIIMGFASGVCAMVGYDKVKETVDKIKNAIAKGV